MRIIGIPSIIVQTQSLCSSCCCCFLAVCCQGLGHASCHTPHRKLLQGSNPLTDAVSSFRDQVTGLTTPADAAQTESGAVQPGGLLGTIFPGRSRTEPAAAGADNDASTGSDTTLPDGSVPPDTTAVEIIPTLGLGPFVNGTVGNDTLLNSTLCNGTLGNDNLGNATIGNITLCNSTLAGFDSSNVTVLSPLLAGNSSTEGPVGAVQGFVVGVRNQTVGEVLRGGVAGAANQTVGAIRTGVVGAANQTVGAIRSQVAGAIQNVTSAKPTAADVTRGINDRLASALGAPLAGLLTTSGGASPGGK